MRSSSQSPLAARLGPRLAAIAELALPGLPLADIGTDHGRLPTALVLAGRVPWAVASDRAAPPLARARATIASAGAAERVRVRYQTTLVSGEVVDQPQAQAAREVALDQAPPCLREGLLRLGVGGRARFYCLAALAYGERGQLPQISAQVALLFTVELLAIAGR